jgi:hypothetical protein
VGAVSSRSWQGTTGRAVYSDPSNREFYRLLTRDPGDLQLVLNHVEAPDGLPIAYVLGVRVADVVHSGSIRFFRPWVVPLLARPGSRCPLRRSQ